MATSVTTSVAADAVGGRPGGASDGLTSVPPVGRASTGAPDRLGTAQLANALLRGAAAAAGVALTLRLAGMPDVVGPPELGLLGTAYAAMDLLAAVPAGALSDRWGRRPLLLGGAAAGAAGLLLTGVTTSVPLLLLGRVVQGLGTGATVPPLLGWFSDVAAQRPAARRGRVMAGVEAGTAAGLLGGTVLGAIAWEGARRAGAAELGFSLLALLYLGAAGLLARVPHFGSPRAGAARQLAAGAWGSVPAHTDQTGRTGSPAWLGGLRTVLRRSGLARLLAAWVLLNSVAGLWLTHAVYQLNLPAPDPTQALVGIGRATLSVGPLRTAALPVILASWTVLFIAGALSWGPLLARIAAWRAMRVALGGMLLVCAALMVLNAGWVPAAWRWAALPLFGLGVLLEAGFAPAALSQLAHDADATHRGLTMGLYSVALGLGSAIGSGVGAPFAALWAMNGITAATALLAALALAVLTVGHSPRAA